jgi:hypothetical protein
MVRTVLTVTAVVVLVAALYAARGRLMLIYVARSSRWAFRRWCA